MRDIYEKEMGGYLTKINFICYGERRGARHDMISESTAMRLRAQP